MARMRRFASAYHKAAYLRSLQDFSMISLAAILVPSILPIAFPFLQLLDEEAEELEPITVSPNRRGEGVTFQALTPESCVLFTGICKAHLRQIARHLLPGLVEIGNGNFSVHCEDALLTLLVRLKSLAVLAHFRCWMSSFSSSSSASCFAAAAAAADASATGGALLPNAFATASAAATSSSFRRNFRF